MAMEALNAAAAAAVGLLTPKSVISERKSEPKRHFSLPTITSPFTKLSLSPNPNTNPPPRSAVHGGVVLISSIFNSGFIAKALSYEEALNQTSTSASEVDISGFLDGVISFGVENPVVVAGGAAVLAVPLIVSRFLGKAKPWGVESARSAYEKLGDDGLKAELVDIRAPVEIRQVGSPDIRGLKKKPVSIVYKGEDKPGFLKKLALKFKEPENTTLFILDKFDGSSELVAELATSNGFKAAYAIKDGAEGPRGWMNSGLPWILPKKTLGLDFSGFTDAIDGTLGDGSEAVSVIFGIAAATGLGLLAFSEIETILELLGSAALIQLVSKKFLFAEDRKQTLKQLDDFLTTKVAPKELLDEIKQIGVALLPSPVTSKALPAPVEASKEEPIAESNSAPQKVEVPAATEPTPQVYSTPKSEVKEESLPRKPQSLSPYPYYQGLRPPISPTPSQP